MGDFSTTTFRQITCTKNKQRNTRVNKITEQTDFIDFFRTFLPNTAKQTFFSVAQGTVSNLDHILGHKASLSKYRKIEITSFSGFISLTVIKYPNKKQLRGKRIHIAYNPRLWSSIVGKSKKGA